MKYLRIIPLFVLMTNSHSSEFASEIQTINHIHDLVCFVQNHIPFDANGRVKDETVAVFDWDRVIIRDNLNHINPDEPDKVMEEGECGTLETICKLHEMGIKTCILTARGYGMGLQGGFVSRYRKYNANESYNFFQNQTDRMIDVFNTQEGFIDKWFDNAALKYDKTETYDEELFDDRENDDDSELKQPAYSLVIKGQFVFGGENTYLSSARVNKGKVLEQLIDNGHFKEHPVNVLFIDDQSRYTDNVNFVFSKRNCKNENIFIFKYVAEGSD